MPLISHTYQPGLGLLPLSLPLKINSERTTQQFLGSLRPSAAAGHPRYLHSRRIAGSKSMDIDITGGGVHDGPYHATPLKMREFVEWSGDS